MSALDRIKANTPWAIRRLTRRLKRELRWRRNANQSVGDVFATIYAQNVWGPSSDDFFSGPGSECPAADTYVANIADFITTNQVKSVVDLGCGDFRVAQRFLGDGVSYVGVDIVEPLVQHNIQRHANGLVTFKYLNIIEDELPAGDLCLIREVLQHLSNSEILQVIPKLRRFRFAIYTDYQPAPGAPCRPNRDIAHGSDTRIWRDSALFLDRPPFNVPMKLLFEAPADTVLRYPDERIRTYLLWP